MSTQLLVLGLSTFIHNLLTVVWVGGLIMIVITIIPSAQDVFGTGPQTRDLMMAINKRHKLWVYISIFGLFVTGMIQARVEPNFKGLLSFDSLYSSLTTIKHLMTFLMIAIALYRSQIMGKKLSTPDKKLMKQSFQLIIINAVLGVGVLLLSGLMAAL